MIVESLCCFPETKRKRANKAKEEIRNLLNGFRSQLRVVVTSAIVMQTVMLAIPAAVHYWLPRLLSSSTQSHESRVYDLTMLTAVVILVGATRVYANYQFLKLASRVGHLLVAKLRTSTYSHLLRLSVNYVESRGAGSLLLRFISDSDALRGWFCKSGPKLIADSLTACVIIAALMWIDLILALVLSLPMILCIYLLLQLSLPVRGATRQARRQQAVLSGQLEQDLTNIRLTKTVWARNRSQLSVPPSIAVVADLNSKRDYYAARLEAWGQSIIFTVLPLLLVYGLSRVWSRKLQSEDFVSFVWLTLHLVVLMRDSLAALIIHQKALVSIQRLYILFARSAEAGRGTKARTPQFDELTIMSQKETLRLRPGLHILPQWICCSQLLECLLGFQRSATIQITINDVDFSKVCVNSRRRLVGHVEINERDSQSWLSKVIVRAKDFGLRIVILTPSRELNLSAENLELLRSRVPEGMIIMVQQPSNEPSVCPYTPKSLV